jgi:hypothetical protein
MNFKTPVYLPPSYSLNSNITIHFFEKHFCFLERSNTHNLLLVVVVLVIKRSRSSLRREQEYLRTTYGIFHGYQEGETGKNMPRQNAPSQDKQQ